MTAAARPLPSWLASAMLYASTLLPVWAQVARLDDSASPRTHVSSDFSQARGMDGRMVVHSLGRIEYRLATAPFLGLQSRIFYVIPSLIPGLRSPAGMQIGWQGSGAFASGSGRPGDRVPVWSGVVQSAWMTEILDLTLRIDPYELRLPPGSALSFESYFEIETLP